MLPFAACVLSPVYRIIRAADRTCEGVIVGRYYAPGSVYVIPRSGANLCVVVVIIHSPQSPQQRMLHRIESRIDDDRFLLGSLIRD